MSLDLAFDDAQQAIADTLSQFCAEHCGEDVAREVGGFPERLWHNLAELGVLSLATPEGDGGAVELVAALESLGAALFPGPLPATFFATQLLAESERQSVAHGESLVSLGAPPLMPWAPVARVFLVIDGGHAWSATPRGAIEPVETLGGEPWGRVELERRRDLGPARRALSLYDLALAAYLAAAARALVEAAAEHARTRRQFGQPIGEFQAVAHPLADCRMGVDAAATLARVAAFEFDSAAAGARVRAAAARLCARRAGLEAAHTCHQVFGALGITLEGPVFHVSRRIRQLASQPPGEEAERETLLERLGLGAGAGSAP